MGELGAMFNPGMRHELEERQSKASRREEEGNARDGDDLRIDLASGVAVIGGSGATADDADADVSESDDMTDADRDTAQERRQAANGSLERRQAAARRAAARADNAARKDVIAPADSPVAAKPGNPKRSARPMTKSGRVSR